MTKTAYIIYADGSLDQVCETLADANREKRDLKDMGCKVGMYTCAWEKQDSMIDKLEGVAA